MAQLSGSGTRPAVYTPGISERTGSTTTYYHMDAQGSVIATTNGSQTQTGDMRYDAFGQKSAYVSSTTTFGWNAKSQYRTDVESGLMLLGHRYYDCATGRFISQDPDQDGWNWYAYCGNNPLGGADPDGTAPVPQLPPPEWPPIPADIPGGPWTWHDNKDNPRKGEYQGPSGDPAKQPERLTWDKKYEYWKRTIQEPDPNKPGKMKSVKLRYDPNGKFIPEQLKKASQAVRDAARAAAVAAKRMPSPAIWWVFPIEVFRKALYGEEVKG